jgi:hypothetical protein
MIVRAHAPNKTPLQASRKGNSLDARYTTV